LKPPYSRLERAFDERCAALNGDVHQPDDKPDECDNQEQHHGQAGAHRFGQLRRCTEDDARGKMGRRPCQRGAYVDGIELPPWHMRRTDDERDDRAHWGEEASQYDTLPAVPLNKALAALKSGLMPLLHPPRPHFAVISATQLVADPVARDRAECGDGQRDPPV